MTNNTSAAQTTRREEQEVPILTTPPAAERLSVIRNNFRGVETRSNLLDTGNSLD